MIGPVRVMPSGVGRDPIKVTSQQSALSLFVTKSEHGRHLMVHALRMHDVVTVQPAQELVLLLLLFLFY